MWDGRRWIIANWGMGADSTAWLLLLCELIGHYRAGILTHDQLMDAAGLPRDCDVEKLIVVTAQTGAEWPHTKYLGEKHVLPALAAAGVRLVQTARAGRLEGDGITILDDSRTPKVLHTEGDYTLAAEVMGAATVPTTALDRRCSVHAKGWAIDPLIPVLTGGEPYVQVMGFENSKGERGRATRDAGYDRGPRTGVYPLVVLGWDRDRCQKEIHARTGVIEWPKSACTFCPFSFQNATSRAKVLAGYALDPRQARIPLLMEHAAVACNPKMGLSAGDRVYDLVAAAPGMGHVIADFHQLLNDQEWALVEVRRAVKAAKAKTKAAPEQGKRTSAKPKAEEPIDRTRRGYSARRIVRERVDAWDLKHRGAAAPTRLQRDTVAAMVQHAHGDGWIDVDGLGHLLEGVETARTLLELTGLLTGLPTARPWESTTASRETMLRRMETLAEARGLEVDWSDPMHPRVWAQRRGELFPSLEEFFVLVPSVVEEKENPAFANTWRTVEAQLEELPDAPEQQALAFC